MTRRGGLRWSEQDSQYVPWRSPELSLQEVTDAINRATKAIGLIVVPVGLGGRVQKLVDEMLHDPKIRVVESPLCPKDEALIFDRDVILPPSLRD